MGVAGLTLYDRYTREIVLSGVGHCIVSFLDDRKLDLPRSFDKVDTSAVRFLGMDDLTRVLKQNEDILRRELEESSEVDRFIAVPEGQSGLKNFWSSQLTLCS